MDATSKPPATPVDMAVAGAAAGAGLTARPAAGAAPTYTVHLVGQLTDVVFSFLGPATAALAEVGHRQTVVVMEDPRFAYLPGEFSPSVDLIVIKHDTRWHRWREALPLFWRVLRQRRPSAVHFHGFIPLTFGSLFVRLAGLKPALYYSPHGSKAHGRFGSLARLVMATAGRVLGSKRLSAIVAAEGDNSGALGDFTHMSLINNPVAPAFFLTRRSESASPLVIAGHRASPPEAAFQLAQMSAIFSGTQESLSFHWLGRIDAAAPAAALRAAGVQVFSDDEDRKRAEVLAKGWLYLAPADARGFAVHVAEAMAVGVPCVAGDTPSNRALIEHGVTGFLYNSDTEALQQVASLVDNRELRHRFGAAARGAAQTRQAMSQFIQSVHTVYGESAPTTA
jgi:hypothetical protein